MPVIDDAFNNQSDNSMNRIRRLMDTARQNSPTAAKVIDTAFACGCGFNFDRLDKCQGAYDAARNMVFLNPDRSDEELLTTLVHESRHSLQPKDFKNAQYNIRTNLQWTRATEADAMAHECAAAFEMRSALPRVWDKFKEKHAGIAASYEKTIGNGDQNKALNEAFKAWHDDAKYVAIYDRETIDRLSFLAMRSRAVPENDVPAGEIGKRICRKDGRSYLEAGFMASDRALTVDRETVLPKIAQLKEKIKILTGFDDRSTDARQPSAKTISDDVKRTLLLNAQFDGR